VTFANAHHAEFFRQLFEETACKLAGRVVHVRFQQPVSVHAIGETFQDEFSQVIIDIRPSLPLEKQFEALLHEVGHVKAGHTDMMGPTPYLPPGSFVPRPPTTKAQQIAEEIAIKSIEGEAEGLADKFCEWACRRIEARNLGQDDAEGQIIAKLVCLQNYTDGE
jgi:hypothetical protein